MCLCGTPYGAPSQRHHGEASALLGQRPRVFSVADASNSPGFSTTSKYMIYIYIWTVHISSYSIIIIPPKHFHHILALLFPSVFSTRMVQTTEPYRVIPQLPRSTSYSAHCLHHRALSNTPGSAARRSWRSKVTGFTACEKRWNQRHRWMVLEGIGQLRIGGSHWKGWCLYDPVCILM